MSNSNDSPMARFLFAILQQKCLKDIDWNKVARDPVLSQPITNGHAARMRFSRYRAAVLGHEPQRRNRTNPDKSRVSKKRKRENSKVKTEENASSSSSSSSNNNSSSSSGSETKHIKAEGAPDANSIKCEPQGSTPPSQHSALMMPAATMIKSEPGLAAYRQHPRNSLHSFPSSNASPKIKQEQPALNLTGDAIHTPSMPEPSLFGIPITTSILNPPTVAYSDMNTRMQTRLLTPCSDSDMTQGFIPNSPVTSDLFQHYHHTHSTTMPATASALTTTSMSPPPTAAASMSPSSPFNLSSFGQTHDCFDTSSSPWRSHFHPGATAPTTQNHPHNHGGHHHHQHSQGPSQTSLYSLGFPPAAGDATGCGYTLNNGYTTTTNYCGEHPHGHQHHHAQQREEQDTGHSVSSMLRERELELQMDAAASSQVVKQDSWADGYGCI